MTASKLLRLIARRKERGAALVIVLAFVVLLTGLVVAYFSRSIDDRQLSNSSFNEAKADVFARSAADVIVADLKQEIVNGSTATYPSPSPASGTIYAPTTPANMLPQTSGTPGVGATPIPNLIRRSIRSDNLSGNPGVASRASAIDSSVASSNGRSISLARWNKHYLIPQLNPGTPTDTTPVGSFTAPDWVVVTAEKGPDVLTKPFQDSGGNTVTPIGRYAYAVYDEGGLLDVNVAGYPSPSPSPTPSYTPPSVYKNSLAYADLTKIGSSGLTSGAVNDLVGWRNYASVQAPGTFGSFTGFTTTHAANFFNYVTANSTGFVKTNLLTWNDRTDQMFVGRQELINYSKSASWGTSTQNLQYLTTFSRAINQPSYIAAVQTDPTAPIVLAANLGGNSAVGGDKQINPSFPNTRVQTSFTRNDGSTASVGDPLVNKRFALQRLAWVTYLGPSASRNQSDADIQAIINSGIPWSYLQLGTAANIQKYFGLNWDASNNRWQYNVHNGGNTGSGIITLVSTITNRDPDFFELLKAGITVGSLGKAATTTQFVVSGTPSAVPASAIPTGYAASQVPVNLRYNFDNSVDYHVIQIGANILSEVNPTSFPIRITFNDGSVRGAWEFQGVTDLPYLHYVFNGVLRQLAPAPAHPLGGNQAVDGSPHQYPVARANVTLTQPGNAYMIQVPAVWNPYDPNGTPGVLRPAKFRVVINNNDPLSAIGPGPLVICHFASATKSTAPSSIGKQGLGPVNAKYSIESDVTVGKSTEQLGGGPGTALYDAVMFDDGNGALYREPTIIFRTTAPGNATRVGALTNPITGNAAVGSVNVTSIDDNPLPNYPGGVSDPAGTPFAPFVLGQFPLAFASGTAPNMTTYYSGSGYIALSAGNGDNRVYFTYHLQYQDPNNTSNWITYDTKYGRTTHGLFNFQAQWNQNSPFFSSSVVKGPAAGGGYNTYTWASAIDPRTARFGLIAATYNGGTSKAWGGAPADGGWIYDSAQTTTAGITNPPRQDNALGFRVVNYPFVNLDDANVPDPTKNGDIGQGMLSMGAFSTKDIPFPFFSAGWTSPVYPVNEGHGESDVWMFAPGLYAQNNPAAPAYAGSNSNGTVVEPSYYADADGVVRRATGAYGPKGTDTTTSVPVGLPTSSINGYSGKSGSLVTPASKGSSGDPTNYAQSQSRPLLLHRPFRTVAELGYVFRDLPWKNLDFFTPESGDAALLDLFCINETSDPSGLVAGKVNLNTRQSSVLAAIVSGAYVDDPKITNGTIGTLSTPLPNSIATALTARTADTTNYGPLQNLSELVGKWQSAGAITPPTPGYTLVLASVNCGTDLTLANGYKDGKLSYIGFSGANSVTSPAKELTSVYTPANAGTLMESLANVQRLREAPIRALSNVGQTRVWNLMIDVVAQTGRYPSSATTAADLPRFVVEGEQRYWVHVAIDRLTGQVIDKQVEVVKE